MCKGGFSMHTHRLPALLISLLLMLLMASSAAFSQDDEVVVNEESGAAYREGLELFKKRQYLDAAPLFGKAYTLDERNVAALFAHGLALNNAGKYAEAAEKLELVLEKQPDHEKALVLYPMTLERSEQYEKALAAYDAGIEKDPKDFNLYWGKARVFIRQKKHKEAVPSLIKARDLSPGNLKIRALLAQTYSELGRMEDAFNEAQAILEKNPNHARARVIVADYKRLAGKLEEAREEYQLAAKNIETKAYAEHYIEVIDQKLEEIEIEKEWEARQKRENSSQN